MAKEERKPLMIRGDRLLLTLRVMRLCLHEVEKGLSIARARSALRARFGGDGAAEEVT